LTLSSSGTTLGHSPSSTTGTQTSHTESETSGVTPETTPEPTALPPWAPAVIGVSALALGGLMVVATILIFKFVCKKTPPSRAPYTRASNVYSPDGVLNDAFDTGDVESQYTRPSRPISTDSTIGSEGRFVYVSTDL
uniref:MUC15 protein n=1 Tax=Macrostomum lignano TaxID=282301 RepID=A0A1I8G394_9PLAT